MAIALGAASSFIFAAAADAAEIKCSPLRPLRRPTASSCRSSSRRPGTRSRPCSPERSTPTSDWPQAGYDLLIMSAPSIDEHIKSGKVVAGSRVDLAKSGVGVGVKASAPKPDVSTSDALKKTLLAAKSIGYSTGPSGVYMIGLFQRLGIADEIKPKLKQTPTGRVRRQHHRQRRS